MQRRKFLIGAGSLAAGSAAAIGTGAFSSVEANRIVEVNVASDSNAYLGLYPDGGYARTSGGELVLDFSGSNSNGGQGLNPNSETTFEDVFKVLNQGTKDIYVFATTDFSTVPNVTVPALFAHGGDLSQDWGLTTLLDQQPNAIDNLGASDFPPRWGTINGNPVQDSDIENAYFERVSPGEEFFVGIDFDVNGPPQSTFNGSITMIALAPPSETDAV